jgi:two-component system secretion system response regulator SalR
MFKMLVVDDHAEYRESLKQTLSSLFSSCEVNVAESVEELMQQITSNTPNLIFMSIRFSHRTGLELCNYLKTRNPDMDIVVMSGVDLPEYRKAAFRSGAKYFMPKDSLPEEIKDFLTSVA